MAIFNWTLKPRTEGDASIRRAAEDAERRKNRINPSAFTDDLVDRGDYGAMGDALQTQEYRPSRDDVDSPVQLTANQQRDAWLEHAVRASQDSGDGRSLYIGRPDMGVRDEVLGGAMMSPKSYILDGSGAITNVPGLDMERYAGNHYAGGGVYDPQASTDNLARAAAQSRAMRTVKDQMMAEYGPSRNQMIAQERWRRQELARSPYGMGREMLRSDLKRDEDILRHRQSMESNTLLQNAETERLRLTKAAELQQKQAELNNELEKQKLINTGNIGVAEQNRLSAVGSAEQNKLGSIGAAQATAQGGIQQTQITQDAETQRLLETFKNEPEKMRLANQLLIRLESKRSKNVISQEEAKALSQYNLQKLIGTQQMDQTNANNESREVIAYMNNENEWRKLQANIQADAAKAQKAHEYAMELTDKVNKQELDKEEAKFLYAYSLMKLDGKIKTDIKNIEADSAETLAYITGATAVDVAHENAGGVIGAARATADGNVGAAQATAAGNEGAARWNAVGNVGAAEATARGNVGAAEATARGNVGAAEATAQGNVGAARATAEGVVAGKKIDAASAAAVQTLINKGLLSQEQAKQAGLLAVANANNATTLAGKKIDADSAAAVQTLINKGLLSQEQAKQAGLLSVANANNATTLAGKKIDADSAAAVQTLINKGLLSQEQAKQAGLLEVKLAEGDTAVTLKGMDQKTAIALKNMDKGLERIRGINAKEVEMIKQGLTNATPGKNGVPPLTPARQEQLRKNLSTYGYLASGNPINGVSFATLNGIQPGLGQQLVEKGVNDETLKIVWDATIKPYTGAEWPGRSGKSGGAADKNDALIPGTPDNPKPNPFTTTVPRNPRLRGE